MRERMKKFYSLLADARTETNLPPKFVENKRRLKHQAEYEYLIQMTQKPFHQNSSDGVWVKGMPISVQPIESEEEFIEIEVILQNGEEVIYPLKMRDEDEKYAKFLEVLNVTKLEEAMCKELYLYVVPVWESGYWLTTLEDIEAIND